MASVYWTMEELQRLEQLKTLARTRMMVRGAVGTLQFDIAVAAKRIVELEDDNAVLQNQKQFAFNAAVDECLEAAEGRSPDYPQSDVFARIKAVRR